MARHAVGELDAVLFQFRLDELERRPPNPNGAGCHYRARGVKGLHNPLESLGLGSIVYLWAAQDVVKGDAAIVKNDGGRVAGADAQFLLDLGYAHTRGARLDDETLDARPSRRAIHRSPHHHKAVRLLRRHEAAGDKDLFAVQDPLVRLRVESGRALDGGRV